MVREVSSLSLPVGRQGFTEVSRKLEVAGIFEMALIANQPFQK
jgi:hypothetical protein